MTNHAELCEMLRTENSCAEGFYEHCIEAADLIEAQVKQIAQQAEELQALIADNTSMLESLTKEATARCDAEDRIAALEAKCALLAASLAQEEARSAELEANVAATEKDAERYRWLCDGNGYFLEEQMLCGHSNEKESADAAIDAAIAASKDVKHER